MPPARRQLPNAKEAMRAIAREQMGRIKTTPIWTPHEGPQRGFYESTCDEVLYGGAAGGGKSMSAVALPIPWIGHPDLRALVLRRRTGDLNDLIDKAKKVYKNGQSIGVRPFSPACAEAEFVASPTHRARFPKGGMIYFDHCEGKNDWEKYQGQEYQIIVFEELTQFTEQQYLEVKSRLRSGSPGLPRLIRATTNPGGGGHGWVFERWRWWLNPEATIDGRAPRFGLDGKAIPPAAPGEVLHIVRGDDGADVAFLKPQYDDRGELVSSSRAFIPASLQDNPTLVAEDPTYRNKLRDFDPVRRAQLERGDWLVKPAAGLYFQRTWALFVDESALPVRLTKVRFWDTAATEPSPTNPDPDWTVGVLMGYGDDLYWVLDVVRARVGPGGVEALIKATAEMDGKGVPIRSAQDPGSAGKSEVLTFTRLLAGWSFGAQRETGDKIVRFGAFSAQANPIATGGLIVDGAPRGRVRIVRGLWNKAYVESLEGFPDATHDDDADATSGAFGELVNGIAAPIRAPMKPKTPYRFPGNERGFG